MTGNAEGWWTAQPSAALRRHVTGYVGYRTAQPPGVHRGLPSEAMTFIVSLGDPIRVLRQSDPAQQAGAYGAVLGGLHTAPALIARGGVEEGVAVEVTPLGSRALLGRPAADLADVSVEAADVLGTVAVELRERLAAATSWPARFAVLDVVLEGLLGDAAPPVPAVEAAWRLIGASGGGMPIGEVADRVGCSRRYLSGRFRDEFGVSPKTLARTLRFGRAVGLLRADPRGDLLSVASRCGFSDHAHLTREFRDLAGCAPSTWLAEEFPNVQAADGKPEDHRAR